MKLQLALTFFENSAFLNELDINDFEFVNFYLSIINTTSVINGLCIVTFWMTLRKHTDGMKIIGCTRIWMGIYIAGFSNVFNLKIIISYFLTYRLLSYYFLNKY